MAISRMACFVLALSLRFALGAGLAAAEPVPPDALIRKIQAVGAEGDGSNEAATAWKRLVAAGPSAFLPILGQIDSSSPSASNWLRMAVDAIADRETASKSPLPVATLEAWLKDGKNGPVSRRIAYDLLTRVDAKTPDRVLPGLIDDPNVELRRDAIAHELKRADALAGTDADLKRATYRTLFDATRDPDQTEAIAKRLLGLGTYADATAHYKPLTKWTIAGPFENLKAGNYAVALAPEKAVDLRATYPGKGGKTVAWSSFWGLGEYGSVNLNEALGKQKDAIAYAFTTVDSEKGGPAELRLGSPNAVRVFLEGKEVFAREEYHHGQRLDQYVAKVTLKAGTNSLLLKICQNDQKESWAQDWSFLIRVCDSAGTPVK